MTFTTWLGQTISVGDTVAYVGRSGSSVWMNIGKVLEINTEYIDASRGPDVKTTMKVQKLGDNSWGRYDAIEAKRPSTLTAFHNILKVIL